MKRYMGLMALALVLAVAVLGTGRPGLAADPEPKVVDIVWSYEPGPGWPAGWTPPEAPKAIPQGIIDSWNWAKSIGADVGERMAMRVLPFLPPWTKEYPYIWGSEEFRCGNTEYVYFQPILDRELLFQTYGDGYASSQGAFGGQDCVFTPMNNIRHTRVSDEQRRRFALETRLDEEMSYSGKGASEQELDACAAQDYNSGPDNIHVCFNAGNASALFDVPAYLDQSAGRVRVPVRFVSELMRAEVTWDNPSQTVTIQFPAISRPTVRPVPKPGLKPSDWTLPNQYGFDLGQIDIVETTYEQPARTITLTVGKKVAVVDGKEVAFDAPPVLLPPGRVMVPVRFVSEVMGAKVYWVGKDPIFQADDGTLKGTYQVHIFTKAYPFYEYPDWFLETRAQRT